MVEVNQLDLIDGVELIAKARESQIEEKAWDLYLAKYQHMDEESYIRFDEFYNPKKSINKELTSEEILLDVKELLDGNTWVP